MRNVLISFIILLVTHIHGLSCSCVYIPTFCETITYGNGSIDTNYLIIHARVESKSNTEMKVRVLTVLFGTPNGSVLTIPQGYGADCRESIDGFDQNSEYIFALRGRSEEGYHLSICGVNYLNISGDEIIGDIAPGIKRIRIADFPTVENCGGLGSILSFIDVIPTLTSGDVVVSTTKDIEEINIAMYDMVGRLVYRSTNDVLLESEPLIIPGSHFPAGCYAIVTNSAGVRRIFRVVIIP